MIALGFDTSNYTTSCASFDGSRGENQSRLLDVKPGELGLRQSDALFSHVKRLPELSDRLFAHIDPTQIRVIGVSTRPRAVEGSYMPCFLAGESQARVLASALHVPLVSVSHQQGHIAAVIVDSGRQDLWERPFLAWHLSGGTTEFLRVTPEGDAFHCEKLGGTTDISAGQLIDRTGQLLGMPFPSGKELDLAAGDSTNCDFFRVKVQNCSFSFSGVQNQVQNYYAKTADIGRTAAFALRSVAEAIDTATKQARTQYPEDPVLFSGGVASNRLLRTRLSGMDAVFARPQFSTDNALGVAVLAYRAFIK